MSLTAKQPRIAIATGEDYALPGKDCWKDDRDLRKALLSIMGQEEGVDIINWRDENQPWERYDAIFVSSTWDIPHHPQAFFQWVDRCTTNRQRLINDSQLILDNVIKSCYLQFLMDRFQHEPLPNCSIIPCAFFGEKADPIYNVRAVNGKTLDQLIDDLTIVNPLWQAKGIVIKPVISADALSTYLYNTSGSEFPNIANPALLLDQPAAQQTFDRLTRQPQLRGIILQPYIDGVEQGEYSLVFFNDTFSHAIRKPGGFVQNSSKDRVPVTDPAELTDMIAFGKKALEHMADRYGSHALTRTRIDLFKDGDHYYLCELECTEPNTNLQRFDEPAQQEILKRYALAIYDQALVLMQQGQWLSKPAV
ncbi:ATP-grasp domain-containing protein [Paraflavitalea pollutisoli]|uniref:ATP-grasp domain-containing protein n=1 Tax=Paraflavitalea pollutisoli TaxID=3034143 RepID=UPI0023EC5C75|nr:hypothetical protein [Paraflavitalea sp. H1-2-19X]